jgi:NAD(P)-dependent dehydrogenase (short-subunit alcohol dehydrogenase family)
VTALVTGGTRGIGLATSRALAAAGHDVAMVYRHDDEAAKKAVEAVSPTSVAIRADLADAGAVEAAYSQAEDALGPVSVVVHAAVLPLLGRAVDSPVDHLDRSYAIGPRAFFLLAQQAGRRMASGGRIVFISSLGTFRAAPGYVAIGAAKGAADNLVRSFAAELGRGGITVNSVVAPEVESHHLHEHPDGEMVRALMERRTPLRRIGTEDDIARAVVLVCRPEAGFITGQQIVADGGFSVTF